MEGRKQEGGKEERKEEKSEKREDPRPGMENTQNETRTSY